MNPPHGSPNETRSAPAAPRRKRRFVRAFLIALLLLASALIVVRLALPSMLRSYVNRTLDFSPKFDGSIGDIEIHLWRGQYTIRDVRIVKTSRYVPVPFFESPAVDVALDWSALLRGSVRGMIRMDHPKLNFVQGRSKEETQTGADEPWLEVLDRLFPFQIDRAEIHQGAIHFRTFHTDPKVNVYIAEIDAELSNLTNVDDSTDVLMARVKATGTAMGSGRLEFDMHLDPNSHHPHFNLATKLLDLDVRRLNALARAFGDFDFEEGRFDLVVEVATKDGFLQGYAKPLFRDLQIVALRDATADDPLQIFWEALLGIVGEVFQNQPRDQFGTRITLDGEFDSPRTSTLEIVGNVLRNAFVQAYLPNVERRVAPREVTIENAASDEAEADETGDQP